MTTRRVIKKVGVIGAASFGAIYGGFLGLKIGELFLGSLKKS